MWHNRICRAAPLCLFLPTRSGLAVLSYLIPTAYAVGFILAPVRGFAGLMQELAPASRLRAGACAVLFLPVHLAKKCTGGDINQNAQSRSELSAPKKKVARQSASPVASVRQWSQPFTWCRSR